MFMLSCLSRVRYGKICERASGLKLCDLVIYKKGFAQSVKAAAFVRLSRGRNTIIRFVIDFAAANVLQYTGEVIVPNIRSR